MADVYAVTATLRLNDQLIAGLRRVAAQLRINETAVTSLQKRLDMLRGPLGLVGQLGALRSAMGTTTMAARQTQQALNTLRVAPSAVASVNQLNTALSATQRRSLAMGRTLGSTVGVGAGRGAVALGSTAGGGGAGAGGGVGAGRGAPGGSGHSLLTGIGWMYTGAMAARGMKEFMDPARAYAHQINILNMAGLKHQEVVEAIGDAWKTTRTVMSSTATENLRSLLDLRNVLGDWGEARTSLPAVAKMQAGLQAADEKLFKSGSGADTAQGFAFSAAKALDILGKVGDPAVFERNLNRMGQVGIAFQNRVTPRMFQGTFQYMRQAKLGASEDFLYGILPTLMLEASSGRMSMGGGSRGVGPMMAAFARVTQQGLINRAAIPLFKELGLLDSSQPLKTTTRGTVAHLRPEYEELARENPFLLATQVIGPKIKEALARHGLPNTTGNIIKMVNDLAKGNQLFGAILGEFVIKEKNFLRDQALIGRAMDPEKAFAAAKANDPDFWYRALNAQWDNLRNAIGITIVPGLIKVLHGVSGGMLNTSEFMRDHPTTARVGATALLGAGGLLTLGVMARGITFAWRGLTSLAQIPGLATLGSALGSIAGGLSKLAGIVTSAMTALITAGLFVPDKMLSPEAIAGRKGAFDETRKWINRLVTGAAPGSEQLPGMGAPGTQDPAIRRFLGPNGFGLLGGGRPIVTPLPPAQPPFNVGAFGERERQAYLGPHVRTATGASLTMTGNATIHNHVAVSIPELGIYKIIESIVREAIHFSTLGMSNSPAGPDDHGLPGAAGF